MCAAQEPAAHFFPSAQQASRTPPLQRLNNMVGQIGCGQHSRQYVFNRPARRVRQFRAITEAHHDIRPASRHADQCGHFRPQPRDLDGLIDESVLETESDALCVFRSCAHGATGAQSRSATDAIRNVRWTPSCSVMDTYSPGVNVWRSNLKPVSSSASVLGL